MKKLIIVLFLMVSTSIPFLVQADGGITGTTPPPVVGTTKPPATSPPAATAAAHLENPLAGVTSLSGLFTKIVDFLLGFSYIVIAFFLILSGFKFITAQGNEAELEKAKTTFYYTIIGGAILVGAQVITSIVQSIFAALNVK